jgi:hypothetical protein
MQGVLFVQSVVNFGASLIIGTVYWDLAEIYGGQ